MAGRKQSRDAGYATIAALVFIAILAAASASVLAAARPSFGLARLGAQEAVADALLDGGLAFAGYFLFIRRTDPAALDTAEIGIGEGRVRIEVRDEAARIDLNAADATLLAGLYVAVGGRSMRPETFAARVIDWRDEDTDPLPDGAELPQYGLAGAAYVPLDGPFRSTAELAYVLGVTRDDVERLAPFVTVFNPQGGIDPLTAPATVLAALPDLTQADAARLLHARNAGAKNRAALLAALSSPSGHFTGEPSGTYRVLIEAVLPGNFTRQIEAVLAGPRDPSQDYAVLYWARRR